MARPTTPCPPLRRRHLLAALALPAACGVPRALARAPVGVQIGGTGAGLGPAARVLSGRADVHLVPSLGSGGGIKAALAGAIDIALVARALTDAERARGLQAREWFRTPLIWAAHPVVPASQLTMDELLGLYAGRTTRWSNGDPVRLVLRPENDSDSLLMRTIGPAAADALRLAHARPGVLVASTDSEAVDAIGRLQGAVGVTTLGMVLTETPSLKVLDIDRVRPSLQALSAGRWALHKAVQLVTRGAPAAPVQAVLDTLLSADAGQILVTLGCQLQTSR